MRIPWTPLMIFIIISIFSDVYIYHSLRRRLRNQCWSTFHKWSSIALYALLVCAIALPRKSGDNDMLLTVMWMLYTYLSVYLAKYVYVIIDIIACIPCVFKCRRVKAISISAVVLSFITFAAIWWGALVDRFIIDIKEVEIAHADIPKAFDGYRIVQISDLHTGTFGNDTSFVSKLTDKINDLSPDMIVFTGDIVNSRSNELEPHIAPLSRLKAKDGVYSIMGNHDYGDYATWDSDEEKEKSVDYLKKLQSDMGWMMLNNRTVCINRGNDSIALIGVENIGDHPFPIYGSLPKAYPTPSDSLFKILLTHNPAHWTDSIADNNGMNIHLTLSGHTHAMQMEIGGLSPAAMRYSTWGGLYADSDSTRLLYVNIGAGTVGFPARIGAFPEVTVLTLHHK